MNDLIDRKKAIETLKEYEVVESDNFTRMDSLSMMTVATIANCIEAIEELPSAEPEIIRCKDCKWRNVYQFPPKYDEKDYCDKHEKTVSTDGFCSWAERRTNE